jgi:putative addiction module component (TIGR02574 family)
LEHNAFFHPFNFVNALCKFSHKILELEDMTTSFLYKEITMNPNNISIFDLSPPEKLQLVEDLWDDLAAKPSEVPIHEWQKDELARRKANLMNKPATRLSWGEVKHRVRSRYGR